MSSITELKLQPHVEAIAKMAEARGLNFYPTEFILVSGQEMAALAGYGGFPVRYPHYSFGQEYEQVNQGYKWGRSRIYEMVINSDPAYAYLMEGNLDVDQQLVMAHVYGHVDFFKNNIWFQHTNRRAVDMMANHATEVRRIVDRVGEEEVERWIDLCLCVRDLIDPHAPFRPEFAAKLSIPDNSTRLPDIRLTEFEPHRFPHDHPDMEDVMNPASYIDKQRKAYVEAIRQQIQFPPEPERDILAFLICHGKMKDWQRKILSIIREEEYYFVPQGQTKIMNEGWAVWWHSHLMDDYAAGDDYLMYADHHSGVVYWPQSSLNPYALGWKLFRHIEDRWNKGKFGEEWEACTDRVARMNWDTKAGLGLQKIFEVRKHYNDVQFLQEFVDREFVEEHLMFIYSQHRETGEIVMESNTWETVRDALVRTFTLRGKPVLRVISGNYQNRGTLLIEQDKEIAADEVHMDSAMDVLKALTAMWGREVVLRTATWEESMDVAEISTTNFVTRAMSP